MSYSRLNDGPRSKGLFHSEFLQNGLTPSRQMHVPVELTPARFEWGLDNYNILRHWTGANTPTMCCGNECLWQVWLPGFSLHCSISARWFLTILYCNQDVLYIYIYWISHDLSRNRQPQNQMMHDDLSCSNPQKWGNTKVEWNQIPKMVIDFDRCYIMCIIYHVPHEQMFMPSKELRTAVAPRETAVLSAPNHWSSSQAGSFHTSYPLHKKDTNVGKPMP